MAKLTKDLKLNLKDIPRDRIKAAKKEAGDFLVNEILRDVGSGKSPVRGLGRFKILDKEYAKAEKGGRRRPNLEDEGDMLEALKFENSTKGIRIGIIGPQKEVSKADGHNQLTGKAKRWAKAKKEPFPRRRFIPDGRQTFEKDIIQGVNKILDEFREKKPEPPDEPPEDVSTPGETQTPASTTETSIDSIFSDENIITLLR